MPKVKIVRKKVWVDMTAMCDVVFLLLTFFILASNLVQPELLQVAAPTSISEIKVPETDVLQLLIDKQGRVALGIDNRESRKLLLQKMAKAYRLSFTPKQQEQFGLMTSVAVPISMLGSMLDMAPSLRARQQNVVGVPYDSVNNQLGMWVRYARSVNNDLKIVIKADKDTPYRQIRLVLSILQELDENRYQLVTEMETSAS